MVAVVSFRRLTGETRSVQMLENGGWEVTETWQAQFDGQVDDPLVFLGDPLIPAIGTAHPDNALLYLKSVPNGTPPIDKALNAINFTMVWSTVVLAAADKHDPGQYVDSDRATKSWSHRVVQEPVEKAYVSDYGGVVFSLFEEPIQNTVGDLFVPGITENIYMPTCRYSRNELAVPALVLDLPGTVNDDEFTLDGITVPIGQAMIIACPVSSLKRSESYSFRTVDYEILINKKGWDVKILNAGFYCYEADTLGFAAPTKKRALVRNGLADPTDEDSDELPWVPCEEPVALDINGIHREQHTDPNDFEPHFRWFRYAGRTSFTALGFT